MTVTANGFSSTTIHSSCASKPNINQQSMDWAYAPPRYFLKNHLCYQPNDFPSCPDVTPSSPDSPTLAIDLTPLVYMTNVVTQRELFVVDHLWENVVLRSFSELTARRRVATSSTAIRVETPSGCLIWTRRSVEDILSLIAPLS